MLRSQNRYNRGTQNFFSGKVPQTFLLAGSRTESVKITVSAIPKGKVIPLQAWTGLEGSRRLRLPDFKTVGT
jgi:hypothetical protein